MRVDVLLELGAGDALLSRSRSVLDVVRVKSHFVVDVDQLDHGPACNLNSQELGFKIDRKHARDRLTCCGPRLWTAPTVSRRNKHCFTASIVSGNLDFHQAPKIAEKSECCVVTFLLFAVDRSDWSREIRSRLPLADGFQVQNCGAWRGEALILAGQKCHIFTKCVRAQKSCHGDMSRGTKLRSICMVYILSTRLFTYAMRGRSQLSMKVNKGRRRLW